MISNGQLLQTKLHFLELNATLGSSLRSLPSETTEYSGFKILIYFRKKNNNLASLVLKLILWPVLFNLPQVWQARTFPVLLFFLFSNFKGNLNTCIKNFKKAGGLFFFSMSSIFYEYGILTFMVKLTQR